MAKFAYPEIWKKSFLLEIVMPGSDPSEIFTFSLPPENIETIYPQRVAETKTFGGLFFDDYGRDVAKITLSGNTGNSEVRRIYRGSQGDLWLTGKDEIFYIRDHIIRYKEKNKNYGDAKLYLYNLATITDEEISGGNYKAAIDSWEVILKDFRVSQSKDRPFWYSYTIEFTGLRILGKDKDVSSASSTTSQEDSVTLLDDADAAIAPLEDPEEVVMVGSDYVPAKSLSKMHAIETNYCPASYHPSQPVEERLKLAVADGMIPTTIMAELESANEGKNFAKQLSEVASARTKSRSILQNAGFFLQNAYSWSTKVANPVKEIRRQISKLKSQMQTYKSLVTGTINNTLFSIPLQIIRLTKDIEDLGLGIVTAPADIASDVISQFRQVRRGVESIFNDFESGSIPEFVKAKYTQVAETFQAEAETCVHIAEDKVCSVAAASKLPSATPDVLIIPAKSDDENSQVVLAYGYEYVTVTSDVILDTLAAKYLGDPDDAIIIALVNGISEESEIQPGDILRIPSSKTTSITGNEVYSRNDNHGVDIKLSQSGGIEIDSSGGLSTVSGSKNISQAIQSRLAESIGNRIRLTVYGIKAGTGQPISAASSYVATSIKDTVIHDPRIRHVENFVFRGVGDRLYVQFDYFTVDGTRGNYKGVQ